MLDAVPSTENKVVIKTKQKKSLPPWSLHTSNQEKNKQFKKFFNLI